jgi:hypothetical protein
VKEKRKRSRLHEGERIKKGRRSMQANENENEKPFERVSPDQELQPTCSSSINIKTEGGHPL